MGNGRIVQRLESGIIAQRRNDSKVLRLVVDGRPRKKETALVRAVSDFSLFSESATPRPGPFEADMREPNTPGLVSKTGVREIVSPIAYRSPRRAPQGDA